MRICIPCVFPGGPTAQVEAFENAEMLDYYEIGPDGSMDLMAQTRSCQGGCSDPVETVTRRGVDAVIVAGLSPNSLMRFNNAQVKVYETDGSPVRRLIGLLLAGELKEIGIDQFATLGKTR